MRLFIKINPEFIPLLSFALPDYQVLDSVSFLNSNRPAIYVGPFRKNLVNYLSVLPSYISTVGPTKQSITNNLELLQFLADLKQLPITKKLEAHVNELSEEDFIYSLKIFLTIRKWPYQVESEHTMFDLFVQVGSNLKDIYKVYIDLLKDYPPEVVESSLLTFLYRVHSLEDQQVSDSYRKVLIKASRFKSKIKPAVVRLSQQSLPKNYLIPELRFFDLITDLR